MRHVSTLQTSDGRRIAARSLALATLLACLALEARPAVAQVQKFPYEASIGGEDVFVRSGPGKKYYPTGKLKSGDRVIVHRHDPGGWYMIAPPAGSFSWIRADAVKLLGNRRAVVAANNVPAYVGSSIGESLEVEQLRLSTNEEVQLLEDVPASGPGGVKLYRIAPPRGEYRWILGQFVVPVDDQLRRQHDRDPFATPSNARPPAGVKPGAKPGALPPGGIEIDDAAAGFVSAGKPAAPAETVPGAAAPGAAAGAGPNAEGGSTPEADQFKTERQRLLELDVALRTMAEADVSAWNFDPLDQAYRQLAQTATNPTIARQIELRLATIGQHRQLKSEFDDFLRITSETSRRDAELAALQRGSNMTVAGFRTVPSPAVPSNAVPSNAVPSTAAPTVTAPTAQVPATAGPPMPDPFPSPGPQFPNVSAPATSSIAASPAVQGAVPGGDIVQNNPVPPPFTTSVPAQPGGAPEGFQAPVVREADPATGVPGATGPALNGSAATTAPSTTVVVPPGSPFATVPQAQQPGAAMTVVRPTPQFAGAGIVQKTKPLGPGMPQHVLITPQGQVLAFLQPGPGVDLDRYVGKPMGVSGQRYRRPDLRAELISVEDASPVRLQTR